MANRPLSISFASLLPGSHSPQGSEKGQCYLWLSPVYSGWNPGLEILLWSYLLEHEKFLTLLGFCFLICLPFIAIVDSALIPRETGVKSVYSQWDWIPPFLQETSFITVCSPMCSLGWEHRWSYSYYAGNSGKILVISMELSHVIYCYCLVETSNLITTYLF